MQSTSEITKLQRQTRALKLSLVFAGAITGAFFLGGYFGHGYGVQQTVNAVQSAISKADYPTLAIVYPSGAVAAEYRQGVCIPFPRHIPTLYHHFYVSPEWEPCGAEKPSEPSPALAAVQK